MTVPQEEQLNAWVSSVPLGCLVSITAPQAMGLILFRKRAKPLITSIEYLFCAMCVCVIEWSLSI